jgi:hypothetical protein
MNTKHTPTPLLLAYDETIKMWVVFYNQDRPDTLGERDFETREKLSPIMCDQIDVARCHTQEQAQLIVTAVNSHFELLEALKAATNKSYQFGLTPYTDDLGNQWIKYEQRISEVDYNKIQSAIAKAEGKS